MGLKLPKWDTATKKEEEQACGNSRARERKTKENLCLTPASSSQLFFTPRGAG